MLFFNKLRVAQFVRKFSFLYKTGGPQTCAQGSAISYFSGLDYSNLQAVFYSFWMDLYVAIPSTSRSDK